MASSRFAHAALATRIFSTPSSRYVLRWFLHLGGIGLIPLGILDSSLIPVPGSMDLATVALAARDRELWFYYALMAAAGSVLGGLLTYRLARKGGKETLKRKFPRHFQRVEGIFARSGFAAVAVPALLPPPFPMVPFLVAAGSAQYPLAKFLIAFSVGRLARYFILALLAVRYGRGILTFFSHHYIAILIVGIGVAAASTVVSFLLRGRQGVKT
jgi:membrane protein YqaA with SNARE-associated domain